MLSSSISDVPKFPIRDSEELRRRIERMCASNASTSLSTLTHTLSPTRRRAQFWVTSRVTLLSRYSFRNPAVRFSSAIHERSFEVSWLVPDDSVSDGCGGWAIVESPVPKKRQTGLSKVLVLCIGTSVAVLLAALVHFSLAGKGFKLPYGNPLHLLHGRFGSSAPKVAESDESNGDGVIPEVGKVDFSDPASEATRKVENTKPRVIPVVVDSNQEEALSVLKKLKIIENDVKAGELCTRRQYARWLVRASSLLERNPKHKIVPTVTLSGSVIAAYDDVGFDDPDFESIQALAEAGIVFSKLSKKYSSEDQGGITFHPERFISRHDLIDWRGQLEYDFASAGNMEISKIQNDLLDMKEISPDTSPGIFMDLLAGERSLHRKVFGQVRRLQPNKPATKAQAAVALTSGHMAEAIRTEMLRIETEESSREIAKEEIKRELLDRGEIQRCWDEKMEEEKIHKMEAKQLLLEALDELEKGKSYNQKEHGEYLKKKAAVDCERQLLDGLELEVNEMTERLGSDRAELIAEEENLRVVLSELQSKKEGMLDAKSWLEAEIEAFRILRSWIEDEARKNEARANVLKEVGRRWRWNGH